MGSRMRTNGLLPLALHRDSKFRTGAARRKPTKTLRPKPAEPKARIHTTPKLTRSEFEKLQARAAAEMRSVAN